ncbi:NAD(P)H-binding protein [Amycolatopsis anabasis]|uniref:NAD(P)H-binding protein n=1 Tax=Amycolatopsis anabasis TaxID=1840409 RepID=UPI00131CCB5D|nr:NAD(P)H-binding protein [Amycolatopsis anabasis]
MTILVTGATGSVGRLVVDELVRAGARNVRALTNNPEKAALPAEVEVVTGYLGRPSSLPAALAGVDTVYLAPLPAKVGEFADLAKQAGVRRVVTLSGLLADEEAAQDPSQWHYYLVEKTVEEAGFDWTHLRPGAFMNNTLDWAESIRTEGVVRAPYPHAAQTPIDLGDIAAVAAVALLDDKHTGEKYPMSGPEAISQLEQVRAIGRAIGRDIRFEELTREQFHEAWGANGVPADVIEWLLDGWAQATEHPQEVEDTVERLTGRAALPYAQWAERNADRFR